MHVWDFKLNYLFVDVVPSNLKAGYHPFPAEVNPKQDINCQHEAIECITKDQSPHRYVNLKSGRIQGLEEETALFVTLKPGKNLVHITTPITHIHTHTKS